MDNKEDNKKIFPQRSNPNTYRLEKPIQQTTPVWAATFENTPTPIIEAEEVTEKQDKSDYGNTSVVKAAWDSSTGERKCPACNMLLRMDSVLLNYVCDKCGSIYDPKTLEKIKNDKKVAVSDELKAKGNSNAAEDDTPYIQSPFRSINHMSADSVKCPGCSCNMIYKPEIKGLICNSCGGIYKANDLTMITASRTYDEGELTDINDNQNEITCNNCGAHIVADKNTSATTCAFCGSPALIVGRLSRKFEPDYIIPFKINKEEAANRLIEWAKLNKNIPKSFYSKDNIEKITGIYVPFWLTDAECSVTVDGEGLKVNGSGSSGELYRITREYNMHCRMVPFDGSIKWNDCLMRAIEPFDYKEMALYRESQASLSGFMAERFDLPYYEMTDTIYGRIEGFSFRKASGLIDGLAEYSKTRIYNVSTFVDKMDFYYCLAPIWFINYNYRGEKYQFVVNGQTGKVAGEAPISAAKMRLYYVPRYALLGLVATVSALLGIGITAAGIYTVFSVLSKLFVHEDFFDWALVVIGFVAVFLFLMFGAFISLKYKVFVPWYRRIANHRFQEEVRYQAPPAEVYARCEERESKANKDEFYLATDANFSFSKESMIPYR
ncbi:MAG: zf-TFIIB domain-containing protein [Clostridia bacterium]|nr:zf-TFIIB domain-containing protein [Clostridia bacterium]